MDLRRFNPLLAIAETRVDDAAQAFAQSTGQLSSQQSRLDDLGRFASEYHAIPAGQTDVAMLVNRRAFAARVDDVTRQQAVHVDQARRIAEAQRERLISARRDNEALLKLVATRRAHAAQVDERRTQRDLDDLATTRFIRRRRDDP